MRTFRSNLPSILFILLPALAFGEQAIPSNRLFALVSEGRISLAIGKFDPVRRWMSSTAFYDPPQPQDLLTIYDMKGKLGEVRITDLRRPLPEGTFGTWYPKISSLKGMEQAPALAIAGPLPDLPSASEALPLEVMPRLSLPDYLHSKGLQVPHPFLTQVFEVNLGAVSGKSLLLCAHSDQGALRDDVAAAVYAVALLQVRIKGKNKLFPLASQTSFKSRQIRR